MKRPLALLAYLSVLVAGSAACAGPSGYHIVDRIAGPDGGWDFLRIDPAANRLLVTRGVAVMSIDLASHEVTSGFSPGQRLHDALPVNGGAEVLVTNAGTDTAVFADAKTGAAIATVKTGKSPDAAAFDEHTGLAIVMAHLGGQVTLIDTKTHRSAGVIEVGGKLESAAVDGAGRAFVNVEDRNQIAVIDLAARKVVGRYALAGCDGPTGLAFDPSRGWLIAACDGSTDVVEATTGKLVATLHTGKEADGVALDAARRLAFVPGREGVLSVISLAGPKPQVVDVVTTEPGTKTVTLDSRDGRVYLPTVRTASPASSGAAPSAVPGTFHVLVVGK